MTCREMLMRNHPEKAGQVLGAGGVNACPAHYGYLSNPTWCDYNPRNCTGGTRCSECWDREIPGTLPMQYPIDTAAEAELTKGEEAQWTKENPLLSDSVKKALEEHRARILDSGDRTEFATGAVRDMREGKGRCDLMPLEVVAEWFKDDVLGCIAEFKKQGTTTFLYGALNYFCSSAYPNIHTSKITAALEVAKHFEEGAKKYGENNWQKGIPVHCYIDSAVRHYLKWLRGDKDEPHDRAFVWNLMCCIWEVDYNTKREEEA